MKKPISICLQVLPLIAVLLLSDGCERSPRKRTEKPDQRRDAAFDPQNPVESLISSCGFLGRRTATPLETPQFSSNVWTGARVYGVFSNAHPSIAFRTDDPSGAIRSADRILSGAGWGACQGCFIWEPHTPHWYLIYKKAPRFIMVQSVSATGVAKDGNVASFLIIRTHGMAESALHGLLIESSEGSRPTTASTATNQPEPLHVTD